MWRIFSMYFLNINIDVSINDYSFKNICVLCYLKLSEQFSDILFIKTEMFLEFQNKINVEIILF